MSDFCYDFRNAIKSMTDINNTISKYLLSETDSVDTMTATRSMVEFIDGAFCNTLLTCRKKLYENIYNLESIMNVVMIDDVLKDYDDSIKLLELLHENEHRLLQTCWDEYGAYFLGTTIWNTQRFDLLTRVKLNLKKDLNQLERQEDKSALNPARIAAIRGIAHKLNQQDEYTMADMLFKQLMCTATAEDGTE